ncbi:D-2-hydroxyacid dehydrogenase [Alteromonas sp. KUL49]|uniref:D-2-hydroxyacid dehydrogenase n=1 Tax=Alteromonas sp. KUL49 TaxID=2480798 RepID=UPI00102EDE20|nr:D-2-hydroxyacid dehydrogenase [Alteromonas sp. KUL49]TAP38597.1 D-2-hydroxyacid dehydrogenase [Alteromonas sp. KUL49]GEA12533.1 dihydrofolate reductase [Alteromonas sp. KUL49]
MSEFDTSNSTLTILSRDAKALEHWINAHESHSVASSLPIVQCTDNPNAIDKQRVSVLLSDPDLAVQIIPQCKNLQWCQSTWAGNAPLLALEKNDYQLTGIKGIFGKLMREYVFAHLLYFSRNIPTFQANQAQSPPVWCGSTRSPLIGKTLGVLGAGDIAKSLIPVAQSFDMKLVGLTRSGAQQAGYERIYSVDELERFASRCDAVVNLMPDTPGTRGILNRVFFRALPENAILINAGRGSAIVESALLEALDCGRLKAAILDVFDIEPLPSNHTFWHHPNIMITAHTAAESSPEDVASVFCTNAKRFLNNEPLMYQFDFAKGY